LKQLYPTQLLYLHKRVIEVSGGTQGVRDHGLLESAIYRPQASFGGQDLYLDLFSKAAALGASLIRNQPFVDANKRTGFEAMRLLLRVNGQDLRACEDEKFDFVLRIATDKEFDEPTITEWLKARSAPVKRWR